MPANMNKSCVVQAIGGMVLPDTETALQVYRDEDWFFTGDLETLYIWVHNDGGGVGSNVASVKMYGAPVPNSEFQVELGGITTAIASGSTAVYSIPNGVVLNGYIPWMKLTAQAVSGGNTTISWWVTREAQRYA